MGTRTTSIVIWDADGKLEATIFCSKRAAFTCAAVPDQMGMRAVKVSTTDEFDFASDYLIRQVSKGGKVETKLVFGTQPSWAGGKVQAERHILASGSDTSRILAANPPRTHSAKETCRHNGLSIAS
ncbi:MAG: hypothetical protein K2X81_09845 [Candidatus Obscuribacterales bacterium]|nr:hypothetical protein [Candidatus Obscuribacterales bacterium]